MAKLLMNSRLDEHSKPINLLQPMPIAKWSKTLGMFLFNFHFNFIFKRILIILFLVQYMLVSSCRLKSGIYLYVRILSEKATAGAKVGDSNSRKYGLGFQFAYKV